MNRRAFAGELAALAAEAIWVYAGVALLVAVIGDGATVSFGAAAAVVALSYVLARVLRHLDIDEEAFRRWGVAVSLALLYLILRIDIAGEPYLWELGWLGDLLSDPGRTLDGRRGDVATVVLLAAAWARGVIRGNQDLAFEGVLAQVSVGLIVVLGAAVFGPSAEAPGALRWLPVPYMVAGLTALAVGHLQPVETDRQRPFLGAWTLWTGGSLGAIAGLALLAALIALPSLAATGDALAVAGRGLGAALAFVLSPFILGLGWAMERVVDWLVGGSDEFTPEPPDAGEFTRRAMEEEREPSRWSQVFGRVARSGMIALVIAGGLAMLWLAFRRLTRRDEDEEEMREEVTPDEGGALGDLRSLFSGALGRLRGLATGEPRGRDAIGRLYFSMLRRAATEGLARPPSATPLEFAPRLEDHFSSPAPRAISEAFAEAQYGRRPLPPPEVEELRARWESAAERRLSPDV
jgi:hypothetical protein